MLVKIHRLLAPDVVRVEAHGDSVDGHLVSFSSSELRGEALVIGYEPARPEQEVNAVVDVAAISDFRRTDPKDIEGVTPLASPGDFLFTGRVASVDCHGNGFAFKANDLLLPIDKDLLPLEHWRRLTEGDWVTFIGHRLLLWL